MYGANIGRVLAFKFRVSRFTQGLRSDENSNHVNLTLDNAFFRQTLYVADLR